MMWNKKDCPLCGKEMRVKQGDPQEPLYLLQCPTRIKIPDNIARMIAPIKMANLAPHFELEFQDQKPFYQVVRVYPFEVSSYSFASNIRKIDKKGNVHWIAETGYIDLPWNDQEKIIKKLETYIVFS